jgi:hypothetical protein
MPPDGSIEGSEDETFDILSARVQVSGLGGSVRTQPNNCVGTRWVLVPATYTPPRGSTELEFRIRDGVVGRERRVSRLRFRPIRPGHSEYQATPNDTPRHRAVEY